MTDEEANETSLLMMSIAVQSDGLSNWMRENFFKIFGGGNMEDLTPALEVADRVMARVERDGALNRDAIADEVARCLIRLPSEERRPIGSDPFRMSFPLYREFLIFLRERVRDGKYRPEAIRAAAEAQRLKGAQG